MIESNDYPGEYFDHFIEKATRIERALGHLAKAVELDLVDMSLNPTDLSVESRVKIALLGQRLMDISGISYELAADLSSATGIPIIESEQPELQDVSPINDVFVKAADSANEGATPALPAVQKEDPPMDTHVPAAQPVPGVGSGQNAQANLELQTPHNHNLYEKLIDPIALPVLRPVEPDKAITVTIIDDNTIMINNNQIRLTKHELYIFNAMLLLRDGVRTAAQIRALGFYPGANKNTANTTFSVAMNNIMTQLGKAAGKEIIKKLGERRQTEYALNPAIVLVDSRSAVDNSENAERNGKQVKKN